MKKTSLYPLHLELGAKIVPFAGYDMPVQYADGILKEHLHTRAAAGLFDVSHMGQVEISGPNAQRELEKLLPLDLDTITISEMAYTFMPNETGGVIDDLIITRRNRDNFVLVINAGNKEKVVDYLLRTLKTSRLHNLSGLALLSLQGPRSLDVLLTLFPPEIADLSFMQGMLVRFKRIECFVSRCGYTGEDGFEISLPAAYAEKLARQLLMHDDVKPVGLGARDSLRLEAGLCLYGHELNENTSPIEAGLGWTINKNRRKGGNKAGDFVGSDIILPQLANELIKTSNTKIPANTNMPANTKTRVGLIVQSKVPVREGAILRDEQNKEVGRVTSGTFSPSLNVPIAMADVENSAAVIGGLLKTEVRGKELAVQISPLPFVPHRYVKKHIWRK